MPYLKIQTNVTTQSAAEKAILTRIAASIAEKPGKPKRYMMAAMDTGCAMTLGESDAPLAFVELKGIGLPESRASELSGALCQSIAAELGVPEDRIYIVFAHVPRALWGWNGGTF
uniref:L-dopachrome isomerase n=1 Tax=Candidatus Kentrum eta TaxID=2126337 RepID=A0A450U7W8_9GAMM|nr:MAG: Macrophage migration inhibitory factor (MIF) [Candidatus Kentron sp. H]VFJ89559.1 MAG: Macrophage migration inhibitory factor (MIF) [Candidatus Kentron sp. H]VFJ96255.1 MAG: Macrophage migration inhibitory factor (MIF) [Candidatus Kentron sp. H]